jgi:hypothetical protein
MGGKAVSENMWRDPFFDSSQFCGPFYGSLNDAFM